MRIRIADIITDKLANEASSTGVSIAEMTNTIIAQHFEITLPKRPKETKGNYGSH